MINKTTITCITCGNKIPVWPSERLTTKFCSRKCLGQYRKGKIPVGLLGKRGIKPITRKTCACHACGKQFEVELSQFVKRKHCSLACRKKRENLTCLQCGIIFEARRRDHRKYCSDKCARLQSRINRKGIANKSWKGGITPINFSIRKSPEYKLWRTSVFTRDNFTCVWCGHKGGEIHADHINSFSLYHKLRFVVANGRTLCKKCHRATDTYGYHKKEA